MYLSKLQVSGLGSLSQQNIGFNQFANVLHARGLSTGSFTAGIQEDPPMLFTRQQAIIFMTGSSMELIGWDIPCSLLHGILRAQARPVCTAKEVSGPGGVSAGILAVEGYRCNRMHEFWPCGYFKDQWHGS